MWIADSSTIFLTSVGHFTQNPPIFRWYKSTKGIISPICMLQMASGESFNQPRGKLCIWTSPPFSYPHWMWHLQPWGFLGPFIWVTFHVYHPCFITYATNFSSLDTTSSFRLWHVLTRWLRLSFPCNHRSEWVLPPLHELRTWPYLC